MTSPPSLKVRELQLDLPEGPLSVALITPPDPAGLVIVARGDGNSEVSRQVSFPMFLLSAGFAIAACDMFTPRERRAAQREPLAARNVRLLRDRLTSVVDRIRQQADTASIPIGLVASGTLAAAALDAASMRPADVDAVVCRNGRLDLATALEHVQSATLLVAATDDPALIRINDLAFARLRCPKHYDVIPTGPSVPEDGRAWHLSAELARKWLLTWLRIPVAA